MHPPRLRYHTFQFTLASRKAVGELGVGHEHDPMKPLFPFLLCLALSFAFPKGWFHADKRPAIGIVFIPSQDATWLGKEAGFYERSTFVSGAKPIAKSLDELYPFLKRLNVSKVRIFTGQASDWELTENQLRFAAAMLCKRHIDDVDIFRWKDHKWVQLGYDVR